MKIAVVLGTRPEIIRLSIVIAKLAEFGVDHVVVNTGQNEDPALNAKFFEELGMAPAGRWLAVGGNTPGERRGFTLAILDHVLAEEKPDRVLILGDTDSALCATIAARRLGIPVFHMEAGNRCFDERVPEEINRRMIDHAASVHLPYTEGARANLLREGIHPSRMFVTGNPIGEVMDKHAGHGGTWPQRSTIARLGLVKKQFFLVTLHRAENVDRPERLQPFLSVFAQLAKKYGHHVIVSTHPRLRERMARVALDLSPLVQFLAPFGFADFVDLERHALCVLTDSGTVQEEACILQVPCVTLRDVTERPETIEVGANIVTGCSVDRVLAAVAQVLSSPPRWGRPREYLRWNVADTVCRIVLGHHEGIVTDSGNLVCVGEKP